jgi:hypothetical protein
MLFFGVAFLLSATAAVLAVFYGEYAAAVPPALAAVGTRLLYRIATDERLR